MLLGITERISPQTTQWKDKQYWKDKLSWADGERLKCEAELKAKEAELRKANGSLRRCEAERREVLEKVGDLEAKFSLFSPLQFEAFQLANELKEFNESLPPCPGKAISPDETAEKMGELIVEKMVQISAWAGQTAHAYSARFSARVADFAHRLGAKGTAVSELEQYSKSKDVANVIKVLQKLMWEIEET